MNAATTNSRIGAPLTPKQKRRHAENQQELERRDRLAVEKRAKKRGFVKKYVVGADGKREEVLFRKCIIDSLRLEIQQVNAFERFSTDVYLSGEDGLKASGFEPGVDNSKSDPHRRHLLRQLYVKRRAEASVYIGVRAADIMLACYLGATAQDLHALGGPEHRNIGEEVRRILDDLSAYYAGGNRRMDSFWRASRDFIALSRDGNIALVDAMQDMATPEAKGPVLIRGQKS